MVVKAMPAASSMVAANHIYNVADPDGLTFGGVLRQIALAPLMGDAAALYKADKFTWLGTSSSYLDEPTCSGFVRISGSGRSTIFAP